MKLDRSIDTALATTLYYAWR